VEKLSHHSDAVDVGRVAATFRQAYDDGVQILFNNARHIAVDAIRFQKCMTTRQASVEKFSICSVSFTVKLAPSIEETWKGWRAILIIDQFLNNCLCYFNSLSHRDRTSRLDEISTVVLDSDLPNWLFEVAALEERNPLT